MSHLDSKELKILCIGHLCLDMISECTEYPIEDDKIGTTTKINR